MSHFLLANKEIIANLYDFYDDLRSPARVHEVSQGVYFLTHHADCAAALTDKRLSNRPAPFALLNQRYRTDFIGADIAAHLIAFRDTPDVTRARKFLASEFMAFARTSGPLLTELAREAVAPLEEKTDVDFVKEVAVPNALRVMCRFMGFPEADAPQLKRWAAEFFYLFHAIPDRETLIRLNASLADFRRYTHDILSARRAAPENDLISQLAAADPETLAEDALVDNIMLFAADGVENVWAGMANALWTIVNNLEIVEDALANGTSWGALMTECLRLESPGQYQGRIALEPLDIAGVTIRKFSVVLVGLAAANRDPEAFADPTSFCPNRKGARDLSFGLGAHACIGKSLVNLQMAALFEALAPFLNRISCDVTSDMWDGRAGHRWLSTLPINIAPTSVAKE